MIYHPFQSNWKLHPGSSYKYFMQELFFFFKVWILPHIHDSLDILFCQYKWTGVIINYWLFPLGNIIMFPLSLGKITALKYMDYTWGTGILVKWTKTEAQTTVSVLQFPTPRLYNVSEHA